MLTTSQKKPQQNEKAQQLDGDEGDVVVREHGFRGVRRRLIVHGTFLYRRVSRAAQSYAQMCGGE